MLAFLSTVVVVENGRLVAISKPEVDAKVLSNFNNSFSATDSINI